MKFWGFEITRVQNIRMTAEQLQNVDAAYEAGLQNGKKLILGTLSARSGTMWLCDIFDEHENATGITERNVTSESFYRYVKHNQLPIDTTGVIAHIKQGIVDDWKRGDVALVFSPYFSHGLRELYDILRPECVIFAINDPRFTVQSLYNKNFFKHPYVRTDHDLALGYQPGLGDSMGFLFGRLVPNGDFYKTWEQLTRVGKISWWADMVTQKINEQFQTIPKEKQFIFHLKEADQNYEYYKKYAERFGLTPVINEQKFLSIKWRRVKKQHNQPHEWNDTEEAEFQQYTKDWHELYKKLCNPSDS